MSVDTHKIRDELKQLQLDIEKGDNLDPELIKELQTLDSYIQKLLNVDAMKSVGEIESITDQVDMLAANFAVRHPKLDLFLRELAETLGKMGI